MQWPHKKEDLDEKAWNIQHRYLIGMCFVFCDCWNVNISLVRGGQERYILNRRDHDFPAGYCNSVRGMRRVPSGHLPGICSRLRQRHKIQKNGLALCERTAL